MPMKTSPLATRIPASLARQLDRACESLGLRKNFVIESALRDKLEDLLDARELEDAIRTATGFHEWESVKAAGRSRRR